MADSDHFDKDKEKREGWWQKKEDGQPIPSFKDSCRDSKNGILGPWSQAHHVLPACSVNGAADESEKDIDYINDVKYITNWNINNKGNMIGLPSLFSYQFFYGQSAEIVPPIERYKGWFGWFNNYFSSTLREKWLAEILSNSPENYPIHNPVSWGHTDFNKAVKKFIKQSVWDQVDNNRKKHKLDAVMVKKEMETCQNFWLGRLKSRGVTSKKQWDKVITDSSLGPLKPYTMHDVSKHPLLG